MLKTDYKAKTQKAKQVANSQEKNVQGKENIAPQ
jgi:hypothetical protein